MEVKSILEGQGRERWMVVQRVWLVPTLGTVFLEQALKGVGKGVLDRGFCSEQACSPVASAVFGSPRQFAMGSAWEKGVQRHACWETPLVSTMGALDAQLGRSYFTSDAVRAVEGFRGWEKSEHLWIWGK